MKLKKAVFIVVDQGFSVRYLLRSNIFRVLKNAGHRIVILAPNADDEYFLKEFSGPDVFIEKYEIEKYAEYQKNSIIQKLLRSARLNAYNKSYHVNYSHYWYNLHKAKLRDGPLTRRAYGLLLDMTVGLLSHSKSFRELERGLEARLAPAFHTHLFKKYEPDLLITAFLGNLSFDHYIMWEAKREQVKLVSVILGYDNPTTKGLAGADADHIVTPYFY